MATSECCGNFDPFPWRTSRALGTEDAWTQTALRNEADPRRSAIPINCRYLSSIASIGALENQYSSRS